MDEKVVKKFKEFKAFVHAMILQKKVQVSTPLSEFDMAMQFAVGRLCDAKGTPCDVTPEEVHEELMKFADESIYDKTEGWFYDGSD